MGTKEFTEELNKKLAEDPRFKKLEERYEAGEVIFASEVEKIINDIVGFELFNTLTPNENLYGFHMQ